MPEIITGAEARARGLKRYFTGNPCKHGHLAERRVQCGTCLVCLRAMQDDYAHRNRGKIKEYQKNWSVKKRDDPIWKKRQSETFKKWAAKNVEKLKARDIERYRSDPEKHKKRRYLYWRSGPSNPNGELQWLRKNQAQLRALKRTLRNLGAGQSPSEA